MHWNKIKHFLWKNAISYCVFPTEIHKFWNAFFAKQHSENNCAVLKEKIERFTYEVTMNKNSQFLDYVVTTSRGSSILINKLKNWTKKRPKKFENIHTTFACRNQNKKFQNIFKNKWITFVRKHLRTVFQRKSWAFVV